MEFEVEAISRDTIKPSSPTPPHLETFKISLIDKLMPLASYIPFINFYTMHNKDDYSPDLSSTPIADRLKNSLSKTLTHFYPLAGRFNEQDFTIRCNDKGVLFSTTRVKCCLAQLLNQPKIDSFYKFIPPSPPICEDPIDGPAQIGIQLNLFACGGVAICMYFSHKMIDATTIAAFMKYWAAIAKESPDQAMVQPCFPGATLFPVQEEPVMSADYSFTVERSLLDEQKGIIKRFVFDGAAISVLKGRAASESVPNPTRVEALSGFIWKHCMAAATVVKGGSPQPSILSYTVDLRRRMVPPLSAYSVGNIVWKVITHYDGDAAGENIGVSGLVGLLRTAMEKSRDEFVPKLCSNVGSEAICESLEELRVTCCNKNLNPYMISSWCRIGLTELDFGWGKPVWVSQTGSNAARPAYKNVIMLIDGEKNDKIEAWLILSHPEMAALELDPGFLAFATPNPPILTSS